MKYLVNLAYRDFSQTYVFAFVRIAYTLLIPAVKYKARLEDGTVVSESEGVEFTVKEGNPLYFSGLSSHGLLKMFIYCLPMDYYFLTSVLPGYFCPALAKAVKTMKKGEKVQLTVKPQCEFLFQSLVIVL